MRGVEGSPVFWAARGGDGDTLKLLLDKGADPNATDLTGFTPVDGAELAHRLVKLDHIAQVVRRCFS